MQKVIKIILWVFIIINITMGIIFLATPKQKYNEPQNYINKIDSLEQKVDSLKNTRDSIRIKIDTVHDQIIKNIVHYEKVRNDVLNYSVSDDYIFFTEYIRQNNKRFDSINNN